LTGIKQAWWVCPEDQKDVSLAVRGRKGYVHVAMQDYLQALKEG
jgi:hypothetical protein